MHRGPETQAPSRFDDAIVCYNNPLLGHVTFVLCDERIVTAMSQCSDVSDDGCWSGVSCGVCNAAHVQYASLAVIKLVYRWNRHVCLVTHLLHIDCWQAIWNFNAPSSNQSCLLHQSLSEATISVVLCEKAWGRDKHEMLQCVKHEGTTVMIGPTTSRFATL